MHANRILSAPRAAATSAITLTALALALTFAGCKKPTPAAPVDDASLSSALQSRLAADNALSTEPIQASVQNSVATLNGAVSSDAARSLAASDAAQVAGIKTVVNNLTVQLPAPPVAAAAPPPPSAPTPVKKATPKPKPAPVVHHPAPIERPTQNEAANTVPPPPPPPPPAPVRHDPPPPAFRNVTIPSGTTLPVRVTQTLDSATTQQGENFTGTLATDLVIDGLTALRQGTSVTGRVVAVQEAAHYKGSSLLTVELTSITQRGSDRIAVSTEPYSVEGKGRGKNTAAKVGGGAAVGAILGGILGGGKGAAIGAAGGGGLGAGANTITRGQQVQIPSESLVRFHLTNSIVLRVSTKNTDSTPSNPELQQRPDNQPPQ